MKDDNLYIAIDIGGTHARVASFSSLSDPKFENIKIFELSHIFENDFNQVVGIINDITKQKITAIGVGVPGVLNEKKDALVSATNIPEWIGMSLKDTLSEQFNCKVYVDNDAVTSGLGEALYGINRTENFIFMIWGTGVGGAVVEFKPGLKAQKLKKEDYLEEIRQRSYGKALLEKYGKPLGELESKDWDDIISEFEKLVVHVSNRFNVKNIVIGGRFAAVFDGVML